MKACLARRYDVTADGEEVVRELGLPQTQIATALSDALGWFAQHDYMDK